MKLYLPVLPVALCLLMFGRDGSAQQLTLKIDSGSVTLDAENVTIDEVLAEWTLATGLNVVSKNGEGSDLPVTLHLAGVPEREAMATLLRGLSGYIMGERRDPRTGITTIDRLMILSHSAARPSRAGRLPLVPETPVELAPQASKPAP